MCVHWSPSVNQNSKNDIGKKPADAIDPGRFDAGQIDRAAQSCGAGYVVFVAKHVGGYGAWHTKTTDYSLKTSPWKGGKGDMVGEIGRLDTAHVLPYVLYATRGMLWDQGEGGTGITGVDQFYVMSGLTRGRRKAWGQDFPFP